MNDKTVLIVHTTLIIVSKHAICVGSTSIFHYPQLVYMIWLLYFQSNYIISVRLCQQSCLELISKSQQTKTLLSLNALLMRM